MKTTLDINQQQAERLSEKRAALHAALGAVARWSLQEQHEALMAAAFEVGDRIQKEGPRSTAKPRLKPKAARTQSAKGTVRVSEVENDSGPQLTDLMKQAIKSAKGKALDANDITDEVYRVAPGLYPEKEVLHQKILQSLSRMMQQKSKPLTRRGRAGHYRYTLSTSSAPPPLVAANNDESLVDKILEVIRHTPTKDYALVTRKVLGTVNTPNRKRIRNTMYYLRREQKLKQRTDGVWEAA